MVNNKYNVTRFESGAESVYAICDAKRSDHKNLSEPHTFTLRRERDRGERDREIERVRVRE